MNMEAIGYVGAFLLAFCSLPQMIYSVKEGNSDGISWAFLLMWLAGEVITLYYIWGDVRIPLLLNYSANIIFISVILKYKVLPRKKK